MMMMVITNNLHFLEDVRGQSLWAADHDGLAPRLLDAGLDLGSQGVDMSVQATAVVRIPTDNKRAQEGSACMHGTKYSLDGWSREKM